MIAFIIAQATETPGLVNVVNKTSGFFSDFNYVGFATNVKIIFFVLTVILLGIAVFAYVKVYLLLNSHGGHGDHGGGHDHGHDATHESVAHEDGSQESTAMEREDAYPYLEAWEEVKKRANSHRDAEWKLAIIEGDKFVDTVLQASGFPGETMGERLMLIKPDQLGSLQDLWDAHKLRNLLVHEAGYQVRHEQVLSAINAFEKVLKELRALP